MARKTVLVCDNCGKEVEEGKGAVAAADVHRRPAWREAGRSLRRLRGQACRAAGSAPRPSAEGRRRPARPASSAVFFALSAGRAPGAVADPV